MNETSDIAAASGRHQRVALVTGAGGGVGTGIAEELARAGYGVAVNDVDAQAADTTAARLAEGGRQALVVPGDVTLKVDVQRIVEQTALHFGRLDLVVNNAGIQVWRELLELEEADWDRVIAVNLKGCFLCTQAAARLMRAQGSGHIINIGSGSNRTPFPSLVSYTASKGGVEMLTKVAAVELGPMGIRVNCLAPGAIEIERTRLERKDYAATWSRVTPLRRIGTPADVGKAVVMLDDERAAFITGQTILVDGGLFTGPPWPPDDER
jgi:NAD(P)-dependent dehydrogenase (short-subunit alcohol dehydrogenase family)